MPVEIQPIAEPPIVITKSETDTVVVRDTVIVKQKESVLPKSENQDTVKADKPKEKEVVYDPIY